MANRQSRNFTRRDFLKYAGAGMAFVPVETLWASGTALAQVEAPGLDPRLTWSKAPCRFCGVGCGVMVGTEDGVVKAVAGDELSSVNRGLLCIKGYSLPAVLYGEDRLLYPQIRTANGLQRASWDEALDLTVKRSRDLAALDVQLGQTRLRQSNVASGGKRHAPRVDQR